MLVLNYEYVGVKKKKLNLKVAEHAAGGPAHKLLLLRSASFQLWIPQDTSQDKMMSF